MNLKVIAYARNGHTDKFGIPRQSREESPIVTRIVFEPEYSVAEALRGIEGYSHLWILWGFDKVEREKAASFKEKSEGQEGCEDTNQTRLNQQNGSKTDAEWKPNGSRTDAWSPTVRPPRLGGNVRMGVFATRSPYRPNPIGLSSVRLLGVVINGKIINGIPEYRNNGIPTGKGTLELIVSGADVLDGTPIYDIKPYLSFSDSHPDALNGFAEETKDRTLDVKLMIAENQHKTSTKCAPNTLKELRYILSQDPRPGYQDDPEREYKMDYAGYTVSFFVKKQTVYVKKIEKIQK